jgi:uncharacterized membrane protein
MKPSKFFIASVLIVGAVVGLAIAQGAELAVIRVRNSKG